MNKSRFLIMLASVTIVFAIWPVDAKSGCCSRHGGVCGCKCCDGKALSSKCAPYYPSCDDAKQKRKTDSKIKSEPKRGKTSFKSKNRKALLEKAIDGDTIEIMYSNNYAKDLIRIRKIDCPEKNQPHGEEAADEVRKLLKGYFEVKAAGTDDYGRTLADITLLDGKDLSFLLVHLGACWWYRKYAPDDAELKAAEAKARKARAGLWAKDNPVPPWRWRWEHKD